MERDQKKREKKRKERKTKAKPKSMTGIKEKKRKAEETTGKEKRKHGMYYVCKTTDFTDFHTLPTHSLISHTVLIYSEEMGWDGKM